MPIISMFCYMAWSNVKIPNEVFRFVKSSSQGPSNGNGLSKLVDILVRTIGCDTNK